jgi:long-subunit acyl-CoA synthetase (AMP-forming)
MSNDAVVAISFIILTTACAGNFNLKDLIDSKLSKNESLEDQEVIEESKINDFFRNKINQILTKNEKLKTMCDEIMERDDFKEAQEENSIKKLVKCVVSYFKEKKNSEGELIKMHQNILA